MRTLLLLLISTCAYAQTQSSGITALSGSTIDLSAATATKTLKIATSDPATCVVGEMLFRSDLTAGSNIKGCTSTNTWTLQAGGSGATISGTDTAVVVKSGSNGVTRTLVGFTNNGTSLEPDGDTLAEQIGDNTYTGINDFSGATSLRFKFGTAAAASGDCDASGEEGNFYLQSQNGATANSQAYICARIGASTYGWRPLGHFVADTAPATCLTGQTWFDSNATAGSNWYGCTAANTWTSLGGSVSSVTIPQSLFFSTSAATPSTTHQGTGWNLPSTNGFVLTSAGTTYRTGWMQAADGSDLTIYFETRIHSNWNGGTMSFDFIWFAGSGGSAAQQAWIVSDFACLAATEAGGSAEPSWTSLASAAQVAGAAGVENLSTVTNAMSGCAAGEILRLRIVRDGDGTAGTDNLTANYDLKGLSIRYSITAAQ